MASAIELWLMARQAGSPVPVATVYTTGTQQITTASTTTVSGLSVPLGPGTYFIQQKVWFVPSGTIGSTHHHGMAFTGSVANAWFGAVVWQPQSANAVQQTTASTISSLSSSMAGSPTHVAFTGWLDMSGILQVSGQGTLTANATLTTAGDNITIQPASWLNVTQLA